MNSVKLIYDALAVVEVRWYFPFVQYSVGYLGRISPS